MSTHLCATCGCSARRIDVLILDAGALSEADCAKMEALGVVVLQKKPGTSVQLQPYTLVPVMTKDADVR